MAPPCLDFQEKFSSFPGSTLLDSSFSSSLSQGPSHLCFGFFWQVVCASLKFSPRKFLPIFTLVLLGKSWPPPWFVVSWWTSLYLAHERRKLPSVEWGPKAAGCRYGAPWTRSVAGSVVSTCLVLGENVTPQVETLVHYWVNMTQQNKMQVM